LKIVNLTGHKLISGYPEGRRMWLNIKWYNQNNNKIREDGAYGVVTTIVNPVDAINYGVNSIMDLYDPNTKIYEAHYAMTKEWADQLLELGYPQDLPLSFDRGTGATDYTLNDLSNQATGTYHETFHVVLNNHLAKDNRIPTYKMSYTEAEKRNALPVPADQYGAPVTGGSYNHWDDMTLNPPNNAMYATIDLLYQPTSWEYIQFLWKANTGQNAFLANEGVNLLDTWLKTGMAAPYVMASTTWGLAPTPLTPAVVVNSLTTWSVSRQGDLVGQTSTFKRGDTVGIEAIVQAEVGTALSGAQVFMEIQDQNGVVVASLQGFTDTLGIAVLQWKTSKNQAAGNYSAVVTNIIKSGYEYTFDPNNPDSVAFTIR